MRSVSAFFLSSILSPSPSFCSSKYIMSAVQTVLLYPFLRDTGLFFSLILKTSLSFSLHIRSLSSKLMASSPVTKSSFSAHRQALTPIFTIESEQEQSELRTVCTKRQTDLANLILSKKCQKNVQSHVFKKKKKSRKCDFCDFFFLSLVGRY